MLGETSGRWVGLRRIDSSSLRGKVSSSGLSQILPFKLRLSETLCVFYSALGES